MIYHNDSPSENDTGTPWQLWVVIALLAAEGIGNLFAIVTMPIAAVWLALKLLFIVGLILRWRFVFVLFVVVAAVHVLVFATYAPFIAFLNLLILILASSQFRRFFPAHDSRGYNQQPTKA